MAYKSYFSSLLHFFLEWFWWSDYYLIVQENNTNGILLIIIYKSYSSGYDGWKAEQERKAANLRLH